MKTAIIRCGDYVRFIITKHPEYRVQKLQENMPVGSDLVLMGVTSTKAKDIRLQFANCQVRNSIWYELNGEFEEYLSRIIGR